MHNSKKNNASPPLQDVLEQSLSRRQFLRNASVIGAGLSLSYCTGSEVGKKTPKQLTYNEVSHEITDNFRVPEGYVSQVLLRWGDPLFQGMQDFDPRVQTVEEQNRRFGYNNDFVGFVPFPLGSNSSDHGLLVVNHEYTTTELMFPDAARSERLNEEQTDIDIAAHGLSVVEVKRNGDSWHVVLDSQYNRRITPNTKMAMAGPASGSARLHSSFSDDGVQTLGTFANCAGGVTPWGTVLTAEENFNNYYAGSISGLAEEENYQRMGLGKTYRSWGKYHARWHMGKDPNSAMHMGWIVEIDPFDPLSVPKKRTALGRLKHEGANIHINSTGHIVAYSGDDEAFEYIYKFVSKNKYRADDREANMKLLDEGTLYAGKFEANGDLVWLPLEYGLGPLTKANGFSSQSDVSLDTRKAADLMGATPMDRPEDVEPNPVTGRVYAMLTKNPRRKISQIDAANPRALNRDGQILEFYPKDGDHTNDIFAWELFLIAGDPEKTVTLYHPDTSELGWLSCPDNCAFDRLGNLWIATDGAQSAGVADGLWATEVKGKHRGLTKRFMAIPVGAEMCGPFFTPDSETLFCAVQHPAAGSDYENPSTRWPDYKDDMPPRPSLVATRKKGGGRVGT